MATNKASDGTSTSGGVHLDFPLAKAPHRPPGGSGESAESGVVCLSIRARMPIVPIGFDYQHSRLEHEIGLESPKHRLMHLEPESPLLELVTEKALDGGHLCRIPMAKTTLAHLLDAFGSMPMAKKAAPRRSALTIKHPSTYLLSRLRRDSMAKHRLAHLLSIFGTSPLPKMGQAHLLSRLRRSFVNSPRHLMSNYNTKLRLVK